MLLLSAMIYLGWGILHASRSSHVVVQDINNSFQLFLGIIYIVHFSQHELYEESAICLCFYQAPQKKGDVYSIRPWAMSRHREIVIKSVFPLLGTPVLHNQASLVVGWNTWSVEGP